MTDLNTLSYSEEHEWVALDGDTATIGITDFAADQLGDIVYVELPEVGKVLTLGMVFGEAESIKSVSPLYSPVAGTVVEVNSAVADDPALVNNSPYGEAWLIKVQVADGALDGLLDRDAYVAMTEG